MTVTPRVVHRLRGRTSGAELDTEGGRRRRELLTELGRAAAEAVNELVRSRLGTGARPGIVVSSKYSSRVRGSGVSAEAEALGAEQPQPRKRSSPSWGRLIARAYKVDPLVCTRCGKRMRVVAFGTDQLAIGKILDHLGLSTPEAEKPPPPVPELLRVAEHGEGWGAPAHWGSSLTS